jgi:hypothetical protein
MEWIAKLYELDAQGIADEELVDKVGYRMYERCRDCIAVSDAAVGRRFACPMCGIDATVDGSGIDRTLRCFGCGWVSGWETFHHSWRHMELGADTTFLHEFVGAWRRARRYREKMLAINEVIHRWHHETRLAERGRVGRPLGVNLIEGSRKQVIAFLDRLTLGPEHDRWEAFHAQVEAER